MAKTTMVDQLLRQSGTFADHEKVVDTVMDNNAIEKRARHHHPGQELRRVLGGTHINIVDTPGTRTSAVRWSVRSRWWTAWCC